MICTAILIAVAAMHTSAIAQPTNELSFTVHIIHKPNDPASMTARNLLQVHLLVCAYAIPMNTDETQFICAHDLHKIDAYNSLIVN